jgi:hypothetical protein
MSFRKSILAVMAFATAQFALGQANGKLQIRFMDVGQGDGDVLTSSNFFHSTHSIKPRKPVFRAAPPFRRAWLEPPSSKHQAPPRYRDRAGRRHLRIDQACRRATQHVKSPSRAG